MQIKAFAYSKSSASQIFLEKNIQTCHKLNSDLKSAINCQYYSRFQYKLKHISTDLAKKKKQICFRFYFT